MQYCMYTPPRSFLHDYPVVVTALYPGTVYTVYNMPIGVSDNLILYHVFSKQENCPFRGNKMFL